MAHLYRRLTLQLSIPMGTQKLDIPKIIRPGVPERITGNYDGDFSKVKIEVGGQPAKLVAVNESEVFFEVNNYVPGEQNLSLQYDDLDAEASVNVVDYSLQAGKLSLNRGEKTNLDISVVGLEGLQEPIEFSIQNESVGTITISGGDNQVFKILPYEVSESGSWEKHFEIQSLTSGRFSVTTNIEVPQETDLGEQSGYTSF